MSRGIPTPETPSLASVLDYYGVRYSPSRAAQMVLCVVHDDRTPSMSINLDKNVWNCHACGESGGALGLIEKKEGVSLHDARQLAARHGLSGGEPDDSDESLPSWAYGGRGRLPSKPRGGQGNGGYVPPWVRH